MSDNSKTSIKQLSYNVIKDSIYKSDNQIKKEP